MPDPRRHHRSRAILPVHHLSILHLEPEQRVHSGHDEGAAVAWDGRAPGHTQLLMPPHLSGPGIERHDVALLGRGDHQTADQRQGGVDRSDGRAPDALSRLAVERRDSPLRSGRGRVHRVAPDHHTTADDTAEPRSPALLAAGEVYGDDPSVETTPVNGLPRQHQSARKPPRRLGAPDLRRRVGRARGRHDRHRRGLGGVRTGCVDGPQEEG